MSQHNLSHYDPAVLEVQKALQLAESSGASPELRQTLESALQLIKLREDFAEHATTEQSQTLKDILEETFRHDWGKVHQEGKSSWKLSPHMVTGHLEGQFLKSIVSIQKAKRVLEVGMFTGYSALAMAEALPADGELVSVDILEYLKTLVTDLVKSSPHHKKIKIVTGDALDVLTDMAARGEKFDIIFLDASQSQYLAIFKLAFEDGLLSPGGTILVDNAFRHGSGYIPSSRNTVTGNFINTVSSDLSLHKVLIPLRDGVLMVRRLSDVEGSI